MPQPVNVVQTAAHSPQLFATNQMSTNPIDTVALTNELEKLLGDITALQKESGGVGHALGSMFGANKDKQGSSNWYQAEMEKCRGLTEGKLVAMREVMTERKYYLEGKDSKKH